MKKILFLFVLLLFPFPTNATVNATSATVKVYKVYFSSSGDCSSPIVIFNGETTSAGFVQVNMAAAPTIGQGNATPGTYPCVIFKMSDQITFVPSASEGNCTAGTSYTIDVCKDYGAGAPTVQNAETGAISTCDSTENTMWVYVSTFSTTTSGISTNDPFRPPASNGDATRGFKLTGAVQISGSATGTFVFGTNNKVDGISFSSCDMDAPDFAFRI